MPPPSLKPPLKLASPGSKEMLPPNPSKMLSSDAAEVGGVDPAGGLGRAAPGTLGGGGGRDACCALQGARGGGGGGDGSAGRGGGGGGG